MEDDDTDAEMVDYGTDFSDDVDPNFVRLGVYCAVDARTSEESGIGPPVFPFFRGIPRFPIPEWPGIGNRETGRFPTGREPGIGVPIRRRGFPGLARLPVPRMALTAHRQKGFALEPGARGFFRL